MNDTCFAGTTGDAFAETVERAVRYVQAGADCVFVPGVVEEDTIRRFAAGIPGSLNVVAGLAKAIDAPTLFSLGVKRVSLGGSFARTALSMLERPGRELLGTGTPDFLDGAIGYAELHTSGWLPRRTICPDGVRRSDRCTQTCQPPGSVGSPRRAPTETRKRTGRTANNGVGEERRPQLLFPEAVPENEEVVPVNVSTWVLLLEVTVGR